MPGRYSGKALAALAAGAFFWLVLVLAPTPDSPVLYLQGRTMGTSWHVQLAAGTGNAGSAESVTGKTGQKTVAAEIQALLDHLDREVFSTWVADSELSLLNQSTPGQPRQVSAELLDVLSLSQQLYTDTLESFDISVGALVNLWGFGPAPAGDVPDAAAVQAARTQQGLPALEIDSPKGTVTRHKAMLLDLSGIAKGHATDRVAELLLARGHTSFLVEIGGELRLQGTRFDGKPWLIAMEVPQSGPREVHARISSHGEALALAGSGDYRLFRDIGGKRYTHEIDPRTGYPVTHNLASVTVISGSAALADAWATALMVLGPEDGLALAESEELAAYFIVRGPDGPEHVHTTAFTRFLYEE